MKVKHDYKVAQDELPDLDKLLRASPHSTLTKKIREAACAICDSKTKVEMHHVRKASDIRNKIRRG